MRGVGIARSCLHVFKMDVNLLDFNLLLKLLLARYFMVPDDDCDVILGLADDTMRGREDVIALDNCGAADVLPSNDNSRNEGVCVRFSWTTSSNFLCGPSSNRFALLMA